MSFHRCTATSPVSSFSLAQLEAIGGGQRAPLAAQRHQVDIVLGLLEMRKAGLLYRVHVHESRIAVELPREPDVKRSVTWGWAAKIVAEFQKREGKPWDANTSASEGSKIAKRIQPVSRRKLRASGTSA